MNRLDTMYRYLQPFRVKWMENRINWLKANMSKVDKGCFMDCVNRLLDEEFCKQKENNQRKAVYFCFFYLYSSILTESFEYEIRITDEKLYLDVDSCLQYWYPDFIYLNAKNDMDIVKEALMKKFVRISKYEVEYQVYKIREDYIGLVEVYLSHMIEQINSSQRYQSIRKDNEFHFLFGEYMGKLQTFTA